MRGTECDLNGHKSGTTACDNVNKYSNKKGLSKEARHGTANPILPGPPTREGIVPRIPTVVSKLFIFSTVTTWQTRVKITPITNTTGGCSTREILASNSYGSLPLANTLRPCSLIKTIETNESYFLR
jgi:hypothetical protein